MSQGAAVVAIPDAGDLAVTDAAPAAFKVPVAYADVPYHRRSWDPCPNCGTTTLHVEQPRAPFGSRSVCTRCGETPDLRPLALSAAAFAGWLGTVVGVLVLV